ncbi:MAG: tetratricopeptide repeat protein [Desulfoplanes sp.]|nr:tetratricopeptide repeat protein [Desulfoplanes sp.]
MRKNSPQPTIPKISTILCPLSFSLIFLLMITGCGKSTSTTTNQTNMSQEEVSIQLDLAESYIRAGKNRPALEKLLLVKNTAQNNPRLFFDLGHVYSLMGNYSHAAESFERAVALKPSFGDAWNYLGQVYAAQHDNAKAIAAYNTALTIPTYLRQEIPAYNLADLYNTQGNNEQAMQYARMAVDKNWRFIPAYLLLGEMLIAQDKTEEAQKWYEQGAESDLTNTHIMLALGENLIRLDRFSEARQWFKRVIATAPSSDDAQMARDYLASIRPEPIKD